MKRTKTEILENIEKQVLKSKFVANNTLEIQYQDETTAIRLHDTDIITFDKNKVTLNSGGWRTKTTKDRISDFSDFNVYQEKGFWYIYKRNADYNLNNGSILFYDGITFNKSGKLLSKNISPDMKGIAKIKKEIKNFVNLLSQDNLPIPDSGDCWMCLMKTETGKTLGDDISGNDHLNSHIKEKYIPGSLLRNAMSEAGYSDESIRLHYSMKLDDTFKRSLRRYLQKRLISNIAVK